MMQRTKKVLFAGITILALGVSSFAFMACDPTNKPAPDPVPDTVPQPNPEPAPAATPIIVLNEKGELAQLPAPFVDFTAGEKEMKAWEAQYESTLKEEKVEDGRKSYKYLPGENEEPKDKKVQVMRRYEVDRDGKGVLTSAAIIMRGDLLFSDGENLKENVQDILENQGYEALEKNIYQGDKFIVMLKPLDAQFATIVYLKSTKAPSENFDASRSDFPLCNVAFSSLTPEKIKAHEAKVGRTFVEKNSTDSKLVFVAKQNNTHNLQIVSYYLKAEGQTAPSIVCNSVALSQEVFNNEASVADYFTKNGFPKPTPKGDMLISSSEFYTLSIGFIGASSTLILFPKEGTAPLTDKFLSFMPYTKFLESIKADGPIAAFEKGRGRTCEFTDSLTGDYGFESAKLTVAPVVGEKLPLEVIGWTYYGANPDYDEPKADAYKYYECDMDFVKRFGENADFADFTKMMTAWGFELTKDKEHVSRKYSAKDVWEFTNKTLHIDAVVNNYFWIEDGGKETPKGGTTLILFKSSSTESKAIRKAIDKRVELKMRRTMRRSHDRK